MATLTVGTNQQYSRIADAIAASRDGDVVAVQAGTYTNDFATISRKITLQGIGGMVRMVATAPPPNGKAILTTTTDVTIDHFEFSGAKVADRNGAGIRYEAGNLTITNSYFHDNENGLLSAGDPNGSITIKTSEFARNGIGDGQTHNLYVGAIRQLTIQDSYFHDAIVGHEIKSRALNTTITGSRIQNNSGNGSYEIDLPQGGNGLIQGNVIQQGANSQNPAIIAFGEEGSLRASNSLVVRDNVIITDRPGVAVWNATTGAATMSGNSVFGFGGIALNRGTVGQSATTVLASRPPLSSASPIGPAVPPPPVPVVIGSGPDSLVLTMAEDAFQGDAQFTVKIDGKAVGGTQVVTARNNAGATQTFTYKGAFGSGEHRVAVAFINDLPGGAPADGRNIYLKAATFNGSAVPNAPADLLGNWTKIFTVPAQSAAPPTLAPPPVTPPPVTPAPAPTGTPTTVKFTLSEDAYLGHAQAYLSIDGQHLGGLHTVVASHMLGQKQTLSFVTPLTAGPHVATVEFVNDRYDGTTTTDRNLYVHGIEIGTQRLAVAASLMAAGAQSFTVPAPASLLGILSTQTGSAPALVVLPG